MKEILGNNLKHFFDALDPHYNNAEIKYASDKYEVWEVSDDLYKQMCDMSEEEFYKIAGDCAWWKSSEGSVICDPLCQF